MSIEKYILTFFVPCLFGYFVLYPIFRFFVESCFVDIFRDIFVNEIRARFFPSESQKRVKRLFGEIEKCDALLNEILLRENLFKDAAHIQAKIGNIRGGAA